MSWLGRLLGRTPPASRPEEAMTRALAAAQAGDHVAALAIWEPLAQAGHARAQNNVGACFAEGLGVARDPALAARWLTLAAEAGDPVGRRNLAALFFRGEGVPQDDGRALDLYRAAAEAGDAPAQDMLSWMLLERDGGDAVAARGWAEAAAAQGVATSMTRLGMIHHNALGGAARDPAAAMRWWRLAAERGEADGQAMLGAALLTGQGIVADAVEALAWLLRAESGGSGLAARFLPAARDALDEPRRAEARRRADMPLPPPSRLPEAAPRLPEAAPRLPEAAPRLPEAAPRLPEAAPRLPEAAPRLPEAAPRLPEAAP